MKKQWEIETSIDVEFTVLYATFHVTGKALVTYESNFYEDEKYVMFLEKGPCTIYQNGRDLRPSMEDIDIEVSSVVFDIINDVLVREIDPNKTSIRSTDFEDIDDEYLKELLKTDNFKLFQRRS